MTRSQQLPPVRLPPWLWLYLGLAVTRVIPQLVNTLREDWAQFDAAQAQNPEIASLRLLLVAETVPVVVLSFGVLAVALPTLRRRWVERRALPVPPPGGGPGPGHELRTEIQRFVDRHAPGVELRFTADAGGHARIYPVSRRRARIMLYGGFPKLWDQHRPQAEAVLLHEVAHRRQGEHLIAGLGSPFSWLIRLWGAAYLLLSVPLAVILISSHSWLGLPAVAQLLHDAGAPIGLLLFPVAALWLAELAADQWAAQLVGADVAGRPLALDRPVRSRRAVWRFGRLLSFLDHPPTRVRRALLSRSRSQALLLVSWPAVVFPAFMVSGLTMVPATLLLGWRVSDQPGILAFGAGAALDSAFTMAITCLLVLVTWPLLSTRWPRLWAPRAEPSPAGPERSPVSRPAIRPYLVASVLPVTLVLGGLPPAPALPEIPPPAPVSPPWTSPAVPPAAAPSPMSSGGTRVSGPGTRPDVVGRFVVYWDPPGEEAFTHEAELTLSGGTGTARVRTFVSGRGMTYVDEGLSLTRVQERWWYAGANPVVLGVDAEYHPDFFLLEPRNGEWAITHVCTSLEATTCYLAWGDLNGGLGNGSGTRASGNPGNLDAATCTELKRQADHFDELAGDAERLAVEVRLDSAREGLLKDARQARLTSRAIRQKMAEGGCT